MKRESNSLLRVEIRFRGSEGRRFDVEARRDASADSACLYRIRSIDTDQSVHDQTIFPYKFINIYVCVSWNRTNFFRFLLSFVLRWRLIYETHRDGLDGRNKF